MYWKAADKSCCCCWRKKCSRKGYRISTCSFPCRCSLTLSFDNGSCRKIDQISHSTASWHWQIQAPIICADIYRWTFRFFSCPLCFQCDICRKSSRWRNRSILRGRYVVIGGDIFRTSFFPACSSGQFPTFLWNTFECVKCFKHILTTLKNVKR